MKCRQRRLPPLAGREPIEFAEVPQIMVGSPGSRANGFPDHAIYHFDFPRPVTLGIHVAGAGEGGAAIRVSVDGAVAIERSFPARPAGPGATIQPSTAARCACPPRRSPATPPLSSRVSEASPKPYLCNEPRPRSSTRTPSDDRCRSLLARSTGSGSRACRGTGDSHLGIASKLAPTICIDKAQRDGRSVVPSPRSARPP